MHQYDLSQIKTNTLTTAQPWHWLVLGWRDFKQAPFVGMAHGLAITCFGVALLFLAYDHFWFLAGAFTGFLAVAPVIAVGLYGVSRAIEQGKKATIKTVFQVWWSWRGHPHHDWRLIQFSLLLCLSGTGWVITSAALITLLSAEPVQQPLDFLRYVVFSHDNFLFEIWLIFGIILGAPVFASTVVTLPLLMDRKVGILKAVLISWSTVIQNPVPMALWATLIMASTMIGILSIIGSIVVIPVLGHASWHAYRAAVDAQQLPERTQE